MSRDCKFIYFEERVASLKTAWSFADAQNTFRSWVLSLAFATVHQHFHRH